MILEDQRQQLDDARDILASARAILILIIDELPAGDAGLLNVLEGARRLTEDASGLIQPVIREMTPGTREA